MEEQNIAYNGITQATSDFDCPDGDLSISHNIVNKDGAMRPIWVPDAEFRVENAGYTLLYVHSGTGFKNYIFADSNVNGLIRAFKIESGVMTDLGSVCTLTGETVNSIQSLGNTLMIFTESSIYYVLWKDGKYEYLGDEIPEVPLSFGLLAYPAKYSKLTNEDDEENGTFKITFDGIEEADIHKEFSEDNQRKISEQVLAKVNKFIQENARDKGMFMYPFFVRYALRLYDGSLTKHSPPVLMMPSTSASPIVVWDRIQGKGKYTEADLDIFGVPCKLDYLCLLNGDEYGSVKRWKDIVKSVDIFISEPVYTYDQNGYCTGFYDTDNFEGFFIGKYCDHSNMGDISSANWSYASRYYQMWKYHVVYSMHNGGKCPKDTLHLPEVDPSQVTEKIKTCSLFYFVKSIDIGSLNNATRETIEIEEGYLDNITLKERMTDDYLSHDKIYAGYSYVYNQRLNIANVKRDLFKGFDPMVMWCYTSGVCDYSGTTDTFTDCTELGFRNDSWFVTTINEDMQEIVVKSDTAKYNFDGLGIYQFYPNANATEMNIVYYNYFTESRNVKLEEHTGLNGAFYFSNFELPAKNSGKTAASGSRTVNNANKVFTSETGNPFYFPIGGINTVGVGEILGISSTTRALSQGQFGQFPLIVFATDGIWAMEVSDTGLYSVKQPISRDVCSNPKSITQIDGAVVFVSKKGLMMADGSNVTELSAELNGPSLKLSSIYDLSTILDNEGLSGELGLAESPNSFFQTCQIAYDYANQRLILFDPEKSYAYLFEIESRHWATMSSGYRSSASDYPECYLQKGMDVINISTPADYDSFDEKKVFMLSRPVKLGNDGFKTVNVVMNRGTMRKAGGGIVVFASHDGQTYVPIGSAQGSRVSRLQGSPYKYFRLMTVRDMRMNESLSATSVYFTRKWMNKPR